jgi:dTDP-4-amino-4,6-dideoxygalactose transaminase
MSTVLNCVHLGLRVVFADIDSVTLQPTVETLSRACDENTVAVLITHYAGYPADMVEISKFCDKNGYILIDDAAHCLPTERAGYIEGAWPSDLTFFSFYATKTITCAEGGLALFSDKTVCKRAMQYRLHGISRDAFDRYTSTASSWEYDVVVEGYKANLPDVLTAMLEVQYQRRYEMRERRSLIAAQYNEAFNDLSSNLNVPRINTDSDVTTSYHLYPITVPSQHRNIFIEKMKMRGVNVSVHFKPPYQMSYWKENFGGTDWGHRLPNVENYWKSTVSLPIFSSMTSEQVTEVIDSVKVSV